MSLTHIKPQKGTKKIQPQKGTKSAKDFGESFCDFCAFCG